MPSLCRAITELKDRSWRSLHVRIRESWPSPRDFPRGARPSPPWEAPWTHPGVSYFRGWRNDKFAPGWLFGDDDRPLRVGPRELVWNDELRYDLRLKVDDLLFAFPLPNVGTMITGFQARPWQPVVWEQWSGSNWRSPNAPGF